MRKLPPLHAIRVFEVCAQVSNFSSAARELCLTHGAVSHQIRQLESWLGQALFTRHANGVQLTPAGRQLAQAAGAALGPLESTCASIRAQLEPHTLRVAAPGSFLALWLIERLEAFERAHPSVRLLLQTQGQIEDLATRRIDALVLSASPPWPKGIEVTTLFMDCAGPVCAPDWPRLPTVPAELLDQALLGTLSREAAWNDWGRAHGLAAGTLRAQRAFDNLQLMLEAAVARLGIAIAPQVLVRREIAQGRLVAPLGFSVDSGAFVLCTLQSRSEDMALSILRTWMLSESSANSPAGVGVRP